MVVFDQMTSYNPILVKCIQLIKITGVRLYQKLFYGLPNSCLHIFDKVKFL